MKKLSTIRFLLLMLFSVPLFSLASAQTTQNNACTESANNRYFCTNNSDPYYVNITDSSKVLTISSRPEWANKNTFTNFCLAITNNNATACETYYNGILSGSIAFVSKGVTPSGGESSFSTFITLSATKPSCWSGVSVCSQGTGNVAVPTATVSVGTVSSMPTQIAPVDTVDVATDSCVQFTVSMVSGSRDSTTNGQVSDLQFFLSNKGYLRTDPTGYFGVATLAAVKAFQGDNGITPNGVVGPITRAKIAAISCANDEPGVTEVNPQNTWNPHTGISGNGPSISLTFTGVTGNGQVVTATPNSPQQNINPTSSRTWTWTSTGAASVSARYVISGPTCKISGSSSLTEENWQPWLGTSITGTRFNGSNTRTLNADYAGCTIDATYTARNTQGGISNATVRVSFGASSSTGVATGVGTACSMESMQCPNGSFVGRTGPNCTFAACSPVASCSYAPPQPGCTYVPGPNYNSVTGCGLEHSCNVGTADTPSGLAQNRVKAALALRLNVSSSTITITSTEAATWNNSCLGAISTTGVCTQVVTTGWKMTASQGGTRYLYHTNTTGTNLAFMGISASGPNDGMNYLSECGGVVSHEPCGRFTRFTASSLPPNGVRLVWASASTTAADGVRITCTGLVNGTTGTSLTIGVSDGYGVNNFSDASLAANSSGTHTCRAEMVRNATVIASSTASFIVGSPTATNNCPAGTTPVTAAGTSLCGPVGGVCPAGTTLGTVSGVSVCNPVPGANAEGIYNFVFGPNPTTAGSYAEITWTAPNAVSSSISCTGPAASVMGSSQLPASGSRSVPAPLNGIGVTNCTLTAFTSTGATSGAPKTFAWTITSGATNPAPNNPTDSTTCLHTDGKIYKAGSVRCRNDITAIRCQQGSWIQTHSYTNDHCVEYQNQSSANSSNPDGYWVKGEQNTVWSYELYAGHPDLASLAGKENGTYKKIWNSGTKQYSGWVFVECRAGAAHSEGSPENCVSNSRACTTAAGSGRQTYTSGSGWGACVIDTCPAGNVMVFGTCKPARRVCTPTDPFPSAYPRGSNVATAYQSLAMPVTTNIEQYLYEGTCNIECKPGFQTNTLYGHDNYPNGFPVGPSSNPNAAISTALNYCSAPTGAAPASASISYVSSSGGNLNTCIVPIGASTCSIRVLWTTSANAVSAQLFSQPNLNLITEGVTGDQSFAVSPAPTGYTLTVQPGNMSYGGLHSLSATCQTGSTWNNSICAANAVNPPVTTASCSVNPSKSTYEYNESVVANISSSNVTKVTYSLDQGQFQDFTTLNGSQTWVGGSSVGQHVAVIRAVKSDGSSIACSPEVVYYSVTAPAATAASCSVTLSSVNFFQTQPVTATISSTGLSSVKVSVDGGATFGTFTTNNGTQEFPAMSFAPKLHIAILKGVKADGSEVVCSNSPYSFTVKN